MKPRLTPTDAIAYAKATKLAEESRRIFATEYTGDCTCSLNDGFGNVFRTMNNSSHKAGGVTK